MTRDSGKSWFIAEVESAGTLKIQINDQMLTFHFPGDYNEIRVDDVRFTKGDLNLQVFLEMPGTTFGPWQVEVERV